MCLPVDSNVIYILPQVTERFIKIVEDKWTLEENKDGTFALIKTIYPEEIYEFDGKLYMKLRGNWYELERNN